MLFILNDYDDDDGIHPEVLIFTSRTIHMY